MANTKKIGGKISTREWCYFFGGGNMGKRQKEAGLKQQVGGKIFEWPVFGRMRHVHN